MRFVFVQTEKATHAVQCLCRVMDVTRSGYYPWATRRPSHRHREDGQLNPHIRVIHMTSRGTYDNPQITGQLRLYLAVALDLVSRRVVG